MDVQRYLRKIYEHLETPNKEYIWYIDSLIHSFSEGGIKNPEAELSKLFDSNNGIVEFTKKLTDPKESKDVFERILKLFIELVKKYASESSPYIPSIMCVCKRCITHDDTAKLNGTGFDLLTHIVTYTDSLPEGMEKCRSEALNYIDKSKRSESLLKAFEFIGSLISNYPESNNQQQKDQLWRMIKNKINIANSNSSIVEGCFIALDPLLTKYENILTDVNKNFIYNFVRKVIKQKGKVKACLKMLRNNCEIFFRLIYKDYEWWHNAFRTESKGSEVHELFCKVFLKFYSYIPYAVNAGLIEDYEMLKFIIKDLLKTLKESEDRHLISFSIKSFGNLVKIRNFCQDLRDENIFKLVYDRIEQDDIQSGNTALKIDFLYGLSGIVCNLKDTISQNELHILEKFTVDVIEYCSKDKSEHTRILLIKSIINIAKLKNQEILDNYLSEIIYVGILKSCRHLLEEEAEFLKNSFDNHSSYTSISTTYRDYVPLWIDMCTVKDIPKLNDELHGEEKQLKMDVDVILYDKFMQCVLEIMKKLDLSFEINDQSDNKSDHLIFFNLVNLFVSVIDGTEIERFEKWISPFILCFMEYSKCTPIKAGAYKLATKIFEKAECMNYFDNFDESKIDKQTIGSFLNNTLQRINEYTGADLIHCLYMVINVPLSCVESLSPYLDVAFEMIYAIGLNDLRLIRDSLSSLLSWKFQLSEDRFSTILEYILPKLNTILQSKEFIGDTEIMTEREAELLKSTPKNRSITQTPYRFNEESQLQKLRRDIVKFLGQISTESCMSILNTDANKFCQSSKHLDFNLPFRDMKIEFYIDSLLPCVIDLVLHSADHRTRVVACELFHGCVTILIIKCSSNLKANDSFCDLFRSTVEVVFKLGAETNGTIQQLFGPLSFQLIHLYTSSINAFGNIILDIIFDGIINNSDGMLRSFSIECLREFVIWSFKHKNHDNIEIVINKLCLYIVNPLSSRRLGSALGFNEIYRILRENEWVVNKFWFQLLYHFISSLELNDNKSENDHTLSALSHIKRVLVEKTDIFNESSSIRKKPAVFKGTTLQDAAFWLLSNSCSHHVLFRKQCMDFFTSIVYNVPGIDVPTYCENILMENGDVKTTLNNLEKNNQQINVNQASSETNIDNFENILSLLDCFISTSDKQLLSLADVERISPLITWHFSSYNASTDSSKSGIISLNHLSQQNIQHYKELKNQIIMKIFQLTYKLHKDFPNWDNHLYEEHTLETVVEFLFNPPITDESLQQTLENLLLTLEKTLDARLMEYFQAMLLKRVTNGIHQFVDSLKLLISENEYISLENRQYLKALYNLKKTNYLDQIVSDELRNKLDKLVDILFEETTCSYISDTSLLTTLPCLEDVLKFGLLWNEQIEAILLKLQNVELIRTGGTNKQIRKGEYFLTLFENALLDHLLKYQTEMCTTLFRFEDCNEKEYERKIDILNRCLKYAKNGSKCKNKIDVTGISSGIRFNWSTTIDARWCNDQNEQSLYPLFTLIENMASTENDPIGCLQNTEYTCIRDSLLRYLNKGVSKFVISKILDLLPFICSHRSHPEIDDKLSTTLEHTLQKYLNKKKSDMPVNKGEYNTYKILLNKILYGLEISCSLVLLKYVVKIVATDFDNICCDEISASLKQFIISMERKMLPLDKQLEALTIPFKASRENRNSEAVISPIKLCLLPMLMSAGTDLIKRFFIDNINDIWFVLKKDLQMHPAVETELYEKQAACILIECLFTCVQSELGDIENSSGLYFNRDTGLVIRGIMDKLHQDIYKKHKEPYHKLYCSAYNVLIAYLRYVIPGSKIKILFAVCYLKRIVDANKSIKFVMEFDQVPGRRKCLLRKRQELNPVPSNSIIPTQYLSYSSLAEDVAKYDMPGCHLRTKESSIPIGEDEDTLELETTDLNDHECMGKLCDFILSLNVENISAENNAKFLGWIDEIRKVLKTPDLNRNIKLFVIKLIHNCEWVFERFAQNLFFPIMSAINEHCSRQMNYFFADTIIMLLEWSKTASLSNLEEKREVGDLLEKIFSICDSERTSVFNYNMDLISLYIKQLGQYILEVPYEIILNQPSKVFFSLVKSFLSCDISPYNNEYKERYINKLLQCLDKPVEDENKEYEKVMRLGFEVAGLTLRKINSSNSNTDTDKITKKMSSILKSVNNSSQYYRYLYCTINSYPEIENSFIEENLRIVQYESMSNKIMYLKIILIARNLSPTKIVKNLRDIRFEEYLCLGNNELQLLTLKVIKKYFVGQQFVVTLLGQLTELSDSSNVEIRGLVYEIIQLVYDMYSEPEHEKLLLGLKMILLKAVFDTDSRLQDSAMEFWKKKLEISSDISKRFPKILKEFYISEIQELFLSCVIHFLLEACRSTPDFNSKLFNDSTADCFFEEQKLNSSWRSKYCSVAPTIKGSITNRLASSSTAHFQIRATNSDFVFQPTVKSVDQTEINAIVEPNRILPTFTSTFFTITSNVDGSGSKYKPREKYMKIVGKKPNSEPDPEFFRRINKLKNRLSTNNEDISRRYAKIYNKRNEERELFWQERQQKKEGDVKFYRSYKSGDLPYKEIQNFDIIVPLQALARRNSIIAKEMLVVLFCGINRNFADKEEERSLYMLEVKKIINDILEPNSQPESALAGAVLNITYNQMKYIKFDVERISSVSQNCGQPVLGCLLLEEKIVMHDGAEVFDPPRKKFKIESEDDIWMKLARLYENLEDSDTVNGILRDKVKVPIQEKLTEALEFQRNQKWNEAFKKYDALVNNISLCDENNQSLLFNLYAKCAANLSQWDELRSSILNNVKDKNLLWNHNWSRNHVLPWLFASETYFNLENRADEDDLSDDMEKWMKEDDKKTFLINNIGEHVTMLRMMAKHIHQALTASNDYIVSLLNEWNYLGTTLETLKRKKILNLQLISEINNAMGVCSKVNGRKTHLIVNLLKLWSSNLPKENDPIIFWDRRITYRNYFLRILRKFVEEETMDGDNNDNEEICSKLKNDEIVFDLSIINCSISQHNIDVAKKYIGKYTKRKDISEALQADIALAYSKWKMIPFYNTSSSKEKLKCLLDSWHLLVSDKTSTKSYNAYSHLFNIQEKFIKVLPGLKSSELFEERIRLEKLINDLDKPIPDIVEDLKVSALKNFQNAIASEEKNRHDTNAALGYFSIAKFCENNKGEKMSGEYQQYIIRSTLRAMKYNLSAAYQLFPTILQLPDLHDPLLSKLFIDESEEVEEWKFIAWINQLVAYANGKLATTVEPILIRLAKSYPQALQFPFILSFEFFVRKNSASKALEEKLRHHLIPENSLVESLISALSFVCLPKMLLISHLNKLITLIDANNKNDASTAVEALCKDFFEPNDKRGKLFDCFRKPYEQLIKDEIAKFSNGEDRMSILGKIKEIRGQINVKYKGEHKDNLDQFSPWLTSFPFNRHSEIEIPGQYSGFSKPILENHAKIFSFDKNIEIMLSLRNPIKITITGNDAKKYSYLVKFDEDLRQDNRIQQILDIINCSLKNDRHCQERKLSLFTYSVVPMKNNLGLIQWIENTVTFDEFMTFKKSLKKYIKRKEDLKWEHSRWIIKQSGNDNQVNCYKEAVLKIDRGESERKFQQLVNQIPMNIYKQVLLSLCRNLEMFLLVRTSFMRSFVTMSMCHWILGIGDRHPENTLVCLKTGHCIGIDFGHAFGTGTQILSVPELIPFRMTPHIQHIMEPFLLTGLIKENMLYCLTALSADSYILLSTMQVFVQEPSVDWQKYVKLRPLESSENECEATFNSEGVKWYPKRQIKLVQMKLEGTKPTSILKRELKYNQSLEKRYQIAYCNLLDNIDSTSSPKLAEPLTSSQQVDHLLNLATNKHILGLSYSGLQLWI